MADIHPSDGPAANGTPTVTDRRVPPKGVLPRRLQSWLMAGIAFVIVIIILLTGHTQPTMPGRTGPVGAAPTLAQPDRIKSFQQRLADEEARQRDAAARDDHSPRPSETSRPAPVSAPDVIAQDDARREGQSLFADNVAMSRRPAGQQPYAERTGTRPTLRPDATSSTASRLDQLEQTLSRPRPGMQSPDAQSGQPATPAPPPVPLGGPGTASAASEVPSRAGAPRRELDIARSPEYPAPGPRLRLVEGTVIETVLLNRLEGTFAGPVACLVTTPVYSQDRLQVLIPAGARVLGSASPVQSWGDSRLAVSFHRLVMPDGHTYTLDAFKGLDAIGETGLKDDVNHHYWQIFGASIAIGALSGLAQYNTRTGIGLNNFGDDYRQAAGGSLANSTSRVLDRYLNVLPTITIREGFRIKVYLTNDLALPPFAVAARAGGVR